MEPTHMAAGGGDNNPETWSGPARRWLGVHDDILGMVLARLESPRDQARFAAVCTSWRALVSTRPPRRVHPWLLLDPHEVGDTKHVYCPEDGVVLPLVTRLNETAAGRCFVGCHPGGWVAYEAPLHIMNVFSGAAVMVPVDQRRRIVTQKVIFSDSPTSSGCILAAINEKQEVVIRGLGIPGCDWVTQRFHGNPAKDITFVNGNLYCLVGNNNEIVKLKVSLDNSQVPVFEDVGWLSIRNHQCMHNHIIRTCERDLDAHAIYMLELRGKLAMAVQRAWYWGPLSRKICGVYFMVFELVDVDTDEVMTQRSYKWVPVRSLGDQGFFLGPTCSKAMKASTGNNGGLRRNHIYYSHNICYKRKHHVPDNAKEFLTSLNKDGCRVYYKEEKTLTDSFKLTTSVGYYVCGHGHPTVWRFPPNI